MRVLLIQVRPPKSYGEWHERECVRRRLAPRKVDLWFGNVFGSPPTVHWLDGFDAMIIGGSGRYSVHDPRSAEWVPRCRKLLDRALEEEIPSLGICFGHQLLGMHLGAEVVTDEARRESGTIAVTLTEEGIRDGLLGAAPTLYAHTGHTDHVETLPRGTRLLATTETSPIQAMKVEGAPFYSTQFHPDLRAEDAQARYRHAFGDETEGLDAILNRFDPERDAETNDVLGDFLDRFVE